MNRAELILKYIEAKGGEFDFDNPCIRDDSDGKGIKIVNWSYDFPKPTSEQLDEIRRNIDPIAENKKKYVRRLNQSFEGKVLMKLINKHFKELLDEIEE